MDDYFPGSWDGQAWRMSGGLIGGDVIGDMVDAGKRAADQLGERLRDGVDGAKERIAAAERARALRLLLIVGVATYLLWRR